jgi:hypothetical protein
VSAVTFIACQSAALFLQEIENIRNLASRSYGLHFNPAIREFIDDDLFTRAYAEVVQQVLA